MSWKPIEEANVEPWHEGLPSYYRFRCLIWCGPNSWVTEGYAQYTSVKRKLVWKNLMDRVCHPTHFMPIPEPPVANTAEPSK